MTNDKPDFIPRRDHITTLDGLRAVAVLMVLWAHVPVKVQPGLLAKLSYAMQPGYFGVDLFFVLSGFLITRILLVDKAANRPVGQFLAKRCLRIFPIYFLVIGVLAIVEYGPYIKWCAVYLSNYYFGLTVPVPATPLNHTWSLAVEEHYYLVWPWLVYWFPIRVVRALAVWMIPLIAVLAAVATVYWFMGLERSIEIVYRGTQYRMFSLAIGGAVACYEPWVRANFARTALVGFGLVVVGAALFVIVGITDKTLHIVTKPVSFSLISVGTLLGALALSGTKFRGLLSNPVLTFVGKISYGLYLYHFIVFYYCDALPTPKDGGAGVAPSRVLLALALSFVIATGSFFLIERPILNLKDRLFKARPADRAPKS